jgi:hypothetical protein
MFSKRTGLATAAAPLFVGLVLLGAAVSSPRADTTTSPDATAASGPVRCAIQATTAGGLVTLKGVVETDIAVSGSYRFKVSGGGAGGSSSIDQGGAFMADPAAPAMLGSVMLGAAGAHYDVTLTVNANGTTLTCTERIGAI